MTFQEPILLAESPVLEGQQIENWCIEKKLGEGGMSVVYLARHMWLSQYAAIKLLRPEFCRDVSTLHRFQQEALAASRLQHENIIEVKDFGRHPEIGYFMILEKLDGVDLDGMMEQTPLPKSWILGIARQVCSALNATHKAGIVHRDLKPSNIFILPNKPFPKVKLLDFGVAKVQFQETAQKLTSTGMIVGTPAYLAPEQVVPQGELTPSADIYSLGVVLYNMFTGRLPIFAENAIQHVIKVLQEKPTKLGKLRPELAGTAMEALLMQMLSKSPHLRPQSMGEVWTKLHEAGAAFDDPLDREGRQPDMQLAIQQVSQKQQKQDENDDHGFITAHCAPSGADSFDNLPEAGPVISLPTGSIAFAKTSDFPTFQKLEQEQLLQAPNASTTPLAPQASNQKIWMGLSATLVLVLCVFTGWWVTGASSSTHKSKHPTQVPDGGPSQLNQLVIKGYKALKKGNYKTAARTWKRVMKQKDWRKSSHFPQLYKAMGIAYQGQKRLNNAVRYFDRYVVEVKNLKQQKAGLEQQRKIAEKQGNKKKQKVLARLLKRLMQQMPSEKKMQDELKEIATVRSHLQQQGSQAERMLSRLQNHLDQDEWKKARQLFEQLKRSLPSHPNLQARLGALVAKQFPHLAIQLYRDILENAEPKETQRKSLLQNISSLQQRVTAQKQSFQ